MNGCYSFSVDNENAGTRIDKFISENIESVTRSSVQKLIESGAVTVNSVVPPKNYKLKNGDDISVMIPEPKEISVTAENIPLDIVYEDNDLLVVNKPKGMVVHPAPGNYTGTLVNALLYHCRDSLSGINGEIRPGIVHRIDKDTSGLLIVAKNDVSHVKLASQIQAHSFKREYEAVVVGNIKDDAGVIQKPEGQKKTGGQRIKSPFGCHALRSFRAVRRVYSLPFQTRNGQNASDKGASCINRSSRRGRYRLRGRKEQMRF